MPLHFSAHAMCRNQHLNGNLLENSCQNKHIPSEVRSLMYFSFNCTSFLWTDKPNYLASVITLHTFHSIYCGRPRNWGLQEIGIRSTTVFYYNGKEDKNKDGASTYLTQSKPKMNLVDILSISLTILVKQD